MDQLLMPSLIDLPKFLDLRGNLSFIEEDIHIPFQVKRVYWIYDVPGGEHRGGHAFGRTEELIVALSGSFDVVLLDGLKEFRFSLNRSYYGVHVPKMVWRMLENFSTNSVALIIASTEYSESDYIRDQGDLLNIQESDGNTINDCTVIEVPKVSNRSGNISIIEGLTIFPLRLCGFFISLIYQPAKEEVRTLIKSVTSLLSPPVAVLSSFG